jgi:hypothetical protein
MGLVKEGRTSAEAQNFMRFQLIAAVKISMLGFWPAKPRS